MKFLREGTDRATTTIAERLSILIKDNQSVIWLVCGGSNIPVEVNIMAKVRSDCDNRLGNLLILPMDERYGKPGHKDSNFAQLKAAGFDPGNAVWLDILSQDLPLTQTVSRYSDLVQKYFSGADIIIGLFGLGADGHTAGVLPKSPAVFEEAASVVGYDSPPFIRITLTPQQLIKTSTAYVLAYGESKNESLHRLKANTDSMEILPSKLLYDIPETFVYNDQLDGFTNKQNYKPSLKRRRKI
ncbi:MAG: 6-phosphogluconolactonase [Candidatus Saccharimonadales bacterium]